MAPAPPKLCQIIINIFKIKLTTVNYNKKFDITVLSKTIKIQENRFAG